MFRKLLPHLTFIMAELFLALNIIDTYNPTMGFLTSTPSKILLAVFCVLVMIGLVIQLAAERRRKDPK